eukprot:gene3961-4931_t
MAVVRDAERFQEWIYKQQHRPQCAEARIYEMKNHPYGFTSQIHVMAHSLLESLVAGYVFLADWKTIYASKRRCPSQKWECFYLPVTHCTAEHAARARARNPPGVDCNKGVPKGQELTYQACQHTSRKNDNAFQNHWWYGQAASDVRGGLDTLRRLSGVRGEYGTAFYLREAVRFIMRPNSELIAFTQQWNSDSYYNALQSMVANQGRFSHVFLSSDDKDAYRSLENNLKKVRAAQHRYISSHPTGGNATQLLYVPLHFWSALGGKKAAIHQLEQSTDKTHNWDEGMLLSSQTFLFSACGGFIGTFESNVGRLTAELMGALQATESINVFDMNGMMYFPGWAASQMPYRGLHHNKAKIQDLDTNLRDAERELKKCRLQI